MKTLESIGPVVAAASCCKRRTLFWARFHEKDDCNPSSRHVPSTAHVLDVIGLSFRRITYLLALHCTRARNRYHDADKRHLSSNSWCLTLPEFQVWTTSASAPDRNTCSVFTSHDCQMQSSSCYIIDWSIIERIKHPFSLSNFYSFPLFKITYFEFLTSFKKRVLSTTSPGGSADKN